MENGDALVFRNNTFGRRRRVSAKNCTSHPISLWTEIVHAWIINGGAVSGLPRWFPVRDSADDYRVGRERTPRAASQRVFLRDDNKRETNYFSRERFCTVWLLSCNGSNDKKILAIAVIAVTCIGTISYGRRRRQ